MEQEPFEQRLQNLWQQGSREVAVSFLRRAITLDSTLAELVAAVQFIDGVKDYLKEISLRDVLAHADSADFGNGLGALHTKRKRRTSEEMQKIKDRIVELLRQNTQESLTTSEICAQLQSEGHDINSVRVNPLLGLLLQDNQIDDMGGKPKRWRFIGTVKRSAEPMMIKKKQAS